MTKAFKIIGYGLCIVFMAWLLLSWVDIVADNSTPNPHHSEYNAFVLMRGLSECKFPMGGIILVEFW